MNSIKLTVYLCMLTLVCGLGCQNVSDSRPSHPFSGLWTLQAMEIRDTTSGSWQQWRDGMQGYLLYDQEGHMALHLTTAGYQDTPLRFPNFVDTIPLEALQHLTNSYVYFANYKLDEKEKVVEHARISHSNPGEWNAVVRRRYSFSGDTLTLQPVEQKNARLRVRWLKQLDN